MLKTLLAAAGAALVAQSAAAETPLIPRAHFFGNPERASARLAPDGSQISFLAPKDGVMNVWVAPASDLAAARPVTDDKSRGVRMYNWAPAGDLIAYFQDVGGNENFHLLLTDPESGETRDVTDIEGVRAILVGASYDRPGEILIGLNDRNPALHDVYKLDLKTGARELVLENPGYAGFLADDDLNVRIGLQQTPAGGFNIYSLDGAEPALLVELPPEDALSSGALAFNDAGDAFYMLDSRGRDKAALTLVDAASGETRKVIAASDMADVSDVLIHPLTNEPLAYAVEKERVKWTALDRKTRRQLDALDKALEGDFQIVSQTKDNATWIVFEDAATAPGRFWLFDAERRKATALFSTRPVLEGAPLQPMRAVTIPARDGLELVSYYTLPPGADADGDGLPEVPQPTLLWVHGGPWARDSYGYNSVHQWMANRGYAVLSANYRGSTGLGKAFINASHGEWAGKMHDDLIDAVDWAIEQGIAKADQIAIGGGSYGGYATLVGVTFTPHRFACGVDIVGPSNLVTLIESFPEYWKPFLDATFHRGIGDPSTEEGRQAAIERSPLFKVDRIKVPLLIGQGANDPRVTVIESEQIVDAMTEKGLPVTYALFPDEGHGFARPENRLAFFGLMEGFLAENCLGGRHEPIGNSLEGSSLTVETGAEAVPGLAEALANFTPKIAH
ncbi:S9 family peptidase [Amphiplicatus metriothermophilus]|uniref:Dipeptidyl aminopeptidase/acylaminoacyl peptidase n=1 Tax=Amphiplicatus metriothermophilus TaxID=1519374 RepID=A0A239PIT7_9PROT|nr:S9 family peptidase [Amphiplicatus metriothermophilus]MBB5518131.1 dipeptidyl aminopeptidase/acylaminoacyl peptidase [Amphiplicatus metriothermophilus]SNT67535.1 Dipeptidyl aminopeptidase/acylaminoacyl peptidase [Amphiplicatus metriothermophilus]